MLRSVAFASIVAVCGSTAFAGQNRPDYSGRWSLVEDRSTPSSHSPFGRRALGQNFKLDQSPPVVTITTTLIGMPLGVRGGPPAPAELTEMHLSNAYTVDGAEHDSSFTSTYRATWVSGQLILVIQNKSGQGPNKGAITSVNRLALSLEADGSMVVDSLMLPMISRPDAPKQEPPVAVRSVYRKVQ